MNNSCQYCGQGNTHLDKLGYCKKYNCFGISGKRDILNQFIKKASDTYTMPDTYGQVGTVVSNLYSNRTRYANGVMRDAEREFGYLPMEVLDRIPIMHRGKWDKNIRW